MDVNMNSTIGSIDSIEDLGRVFYEDTGHRVFYTLRH